MYALWSDGQNLQHLSVYQSNGSGAPRVPAIRVLNATSLSQFNMHPSSRFAYMLEVTSSNAGYRADIRLFDVQSNGGSLTENPKLQGIYGPAAYWPAFLFGFNTDGRFLYDTSNVPTGSVYRQRSINEENGLLGPDKQILSVQAAVEVVLGKVIVNSASEQPTVK